MSHCLVVVVVVAVVVVTSVPNGKGKKNAGKKGKGNAQCEDLIALKKKRAEREKGGSRIGQVLMRGGK